MTELKKLENTYNEKWCAWRNACEVAEKAVIKAGIYVPMEDHASMHDFWQEPDYRQVFFGETKIAEEMARAEMSKAWKAWQNEIDRIRLEKAEKRKKYNAEHPEKVAEQKRKRKLKNAIERKAQLENMLTEALNRVESIKEELQKTEEIINNEGR